MFKKYFIPILKIMGIMIFYSLLAKIFGRLTTVLFMQVFSVESSELTLFIGQFISTITVVLIYLKFGKKQIKDIGIQFTPKWFKKLLLGGFWRFNPGGCWNCVP